MAINPNKQLVPKITNIKDYYEQLWNTEPLPGVPSFYAFLENLRGIDRTMFTHNTWEVLALNAEMMNYSMFLRGIQDEQLKTKQIEQAKKHSEEQMKESSLEDLMTSRNYMQSQVDRLDEELVVASKERNNNSK